MTARSISPARTLGVFAGRFGNRLRHRRTWRVCVDTAIGGVLIALSLRLAVEQ